VLTRVRLAWRNATLPQFKKSKIKIEKSMGTIKPHLKHTTVADDKRPRGSAQER
jgi:hypothetical protein